MEDCPFISRCSIAYSDRERCAYYYEDCMQFKWFLKREKENIKEKTKKDLSDLITG